MHTKVSIYRTLPGQGQAHDQAAHRCHQVLAGQPGFLGRLLGRNCDDTSERIEVLQWESPAHAKEGFAVASRDPEVRAWIAHVDETSVRMFGMRTVGVVARAERGLADPSVGTWLLVRWRTLDHVDRIAHARTDLLMHHEVFAPVGGYLGALLFEAADGPEQMELIAWSNLALAKQRVGEILGANRDLVALHMADCAPGASLHYLDSVLRA